MSLLCACPWPHHARVRQALPCTCAWIWHGQSRAMKEVPQTILASPNTPPPPYRQCPYGNNTFQKGASLIDSYQFGNSLTTTEFSQFEIVWSQPGLHECKFISILDGQLKMRTKHQEIRRSYQNTLVCYWWLLLAKPKVHMFTLRRYWWLSSKTFDSNYPED